MKDHRMKICTIIFAKNNPSATERKLKEITFYFPSQSKYDLYKDERSSKEGIYFRMKRYPIIIDQRFDNVNFPSGVVCLRS